MKLERNRLGIVVFPEEVPNEAKDLLILMDDAAENARAGQGVTSPRFDHAMRVFNQLNAHYQIAVAQELSKAHEGLHSATLGLKIATWWLAGITVLLGAVEIWKMFTH